MEGEALLATIKTESLMVWCYDTEVECLTKTGKLNVQDVFGERAMFSVSSLEGLKVS